MTNRFTAPVIAANKEQAIQESLQQVIPGGTFEEVALPAGTPETVSSLYLETSGKGYVAVLATTSQYSNGDMGITAAIADDGSIQAIALTSYYESKDFGKDTYPLNFIGATAENVMDVDVFSGATYSSTAFKEALADALTAWQLVKEASAG